MSILDLRLQILPYVETIAQEEYNHHKILCIRVERCGATERQWM